MRRGDATSYGDARPSRFVASPRRTGIHGGTAVAKVKTVQKAETHSHPACLICRDGTYATVSLQTLPGEGCEWSHYCDVCGDVMASVVREGQKREPAQRRLPEPPKIAEAPPAKVESPATKMVKPPATPGPSKPPAPTEGYDLLDLLGWKK